MPVNATKAIVDKTDLVCSFGGPHVWDYIRGNIPNDQGPVYKCVKCSFVITKAALKALTDGGS